MSITPMWDPNYPNTMLYEFKGQWTWAELGVAMAQAAALRAERSLSKQTPTIIDMTHASAPPDGNALWYARGALEHQGHWAKQIIVVTCNPRIIQLIKLFCQVYRSRMPIERVASRADAYGLLRGTQRPAAPHG